MQYDENGNPVNKGGGGLGLKLCGGCCLIMVLCMIAGGIGSYYMAKNAVSVEPTEVNAAFAELTKVPAPAGFSGKFMMKHPLAPMRLTISGRDEAPDALVLVAFTIFGDKSSNATTNAVERGSVEDFGIQQLLMFQAIAKNEGFNSKAIDVALQNVGSRETIIKEVGGVKTAIARVDTTHQDGTKIVRFIVHLANQSCLIATGTTDTFDTKTFESYLSKLEPAPKLVAEAKKIAAEAAKTGAAKTGEAKTGEAKTGEAKTDDAEPAGGGGE